MLATNSAIISSILVCSLSTCFCAWEFLHFSHKVETVKRDKFEGYNRICSDPVLLENAGNICEAIKLYGGAACKTVHVLLEDGTQIKRFQFDNVFLCYHSGGKVGGCVTGYDTDTNGLEWDYPWDVNACVPAKSIPNLLK